MLIKKIDYKRLALHILFWITYIVIHISIYGLNRGNYVDLLHMYAVSIIVFIVSVYFTIYFLFPKFLYPKKYFLFGFSLVISAIVFTLFYRLIQYYYIIPTFYTASAAGVTFFSFGLFDSMSGLYTVVAIAATIKLLRYWYKNQQIQQQLVNQNIHSEIALLRSQINPHFLFNTLNNIDSLIFKSPQLASDSLVRLADIMRYMLYESNEGKVPLENEIEYLKSFINLQLLRLKNQDFVTLKIEGSTEGRMITPMLLVAFIENAFKHGDKKPIPGIIIKLDVQKAKLNFWVTNFISINKDKNKDKIGGIGLINVKRRLDLLYPDKYKLDINEDNFLNQFVVKLELNLD